MSTPEAARGGGHPRWAGLGAIAYVVLFIGGSVLMFGGQPETDSAPAKIVHYYKDSGHRDKIGAGWIAVILGVFFFLWFVSALRQYLRGIDGDGFLTTMATLGGVVYASLTLVGVSLNMAIKTMSDDTFHHQVYPPLIHAADDAGWVIHSSGGIGAGALIIATSLAAMTAAVIPRWAGWVGVVFGVLALASIVGFTQLAIALWLVAAGVGLLRAGSAPVVVSPGA